MRLYRVELRRSATTARLVGHCERERRPGRFELYFEFPIAYQDHISEVADPFAAAMLVPAMLENEPLAIDPPISPQLLFNLPRIRDVYAAWRPEMTRPDISAVARPGPEPSRAAEAAAFFSGGVDSFHTLLKHTRQLELPVPLTHIIFMRGLEKPLELSHGVDDSQRMIEAVASKTGVRSLVGESNIRTHFKVHWQRYYYGSGLAATALSLGDGFGYVCIPASWGYKDLVVSASTPLVDERYSTERLQIVHDGAERPRAARLEKIVAWAPELVLTHLRVCVMNAGGLGNCGKCPKCVRTATVLHFLGALEQAEAFPNKDRRHWPKVTAADLPGLIEENFRFGQARAPDSEVTAQLGRILERRRRRQALRTLLQASPARAVLPLLDKARRRARSFARPK